MYIEQIYTDCLAQASYYVESNGEAILIDPIRDVNLYMDLIKKRQVDLKYIFETHFHADFVSGHLELARLTSAEIVFGPNATPKYPCIIATDQQEFNFGCLSLKALHTPGHTMESTCYLLSSESSKEAVFTGDTLFIGEVGRPDLAVNPQLTNRDLASSLYKSLHNVLMCLPDHVIVYPGHGAGSACGKNISLKKQSTIGEQKKSNYALQPMSEADFVELLIEGIPPAPQYFEHDVSMNKNGYQVVSEVLEKSLKALPPLVVKQELDKGTQILDVRMPGDFEKGFIPGSINIGKVGMFAPWVGTLISPSQQLIIVCTVGEEEEVISRLARVGYENVVGYINDVETWQKSGFELDVIDSIEESEIPDNIIGSILLDVRKREELRLGFMRGSKNIPLAELEDSLQEIDINNDLLIYCAGGYRSMIAASILKSKGHKNVKNIYGGFKAISRNPIHVVDL